MGELISGKEALIALANGKKVEMKDSELDIPWTEICVKDNDFLGKVEPCIWMFINTPDHIHFRLKLQTITINGIEVPAPFKPKKGEKYWHIYTTDASGCSWALCGDVNDHLYTQFGAWRTESEVKQVVEALRQVLKCQK